MYIIEIIFSILKINQVVAMEPMIDKSLSEI